MKIKILHIFRHFKKHWLKYAGPLGVILMLAPLWVYIFTFDAFTISNASNDWKEFNEEVGQLLNTIIAGISLLALGYISWKIGENSVKENRELSFLQKRLDAYDGLTRSAEGLHALLETLTLAAKALNAAQQIQDKSLVEKRSEELRSIGLSFLEYKYFVINFSPRYSHLFEYDFNAKMYKDFVASTNTVAKSLLALVDNPAEPEKIKRVDKMVVDLREHLKQLVPFLNSLRKELK